MLLLRNFAFYTMFYSGSIVVTLAALLCLPVSRRALRRCVRWWARYHRCCVENLLGIAIEQHGEPQTGSALYVIKHESFFEAIDAPALFAHPAVFAKNTLFWIPGWGFAARRYGLVPVQRDQGARTLRMMVKEARGLSARGRELVLFPEGTRTPHGVNAPLGAGFAGLYKLIGLPVVPVAVNSGPLYHRLLKRRGTITYRFGKTIPPGLDRRDVEAQVRDAINALNAGRGTSA
ncbi:MAG: 1-acyl-sn-glycerol-3-phosphate acyltransferase [Parerythrobacter sp.]